MDMMSVIKPTSRRRLRTRDSTTSLLSPVNKRLNFSFDAGDAVSTTTSPVLNLNNNLIGVCGSDGRDPSSGSDPSTQFDMDLDQLATLDEAFLGSDAGAIGGGGDTFSPCRTRSGCVYESGLKKQRFRQRSAKQRTKTVVSTTVRSSAVATASRRTRMCSGQSGTGSIADCSENGSDAEENCVTLGDLVESTSVCDRLDYYSARTSPPPLNYSKIPVSRFSEARERIHRHDIPSSPISGMLQDQDRSSPCRKHWAQQDGAGSPTESFSPPTNTMRAMRLFDGMSSPNTACALLSSPRSTPKGIPIKSRLLFDEDGEQRRASCPNPFPHHIQALENGPTGSTVKKKTANINPFTPSAMMALSKKRSRSHKSLSSSYEELQHSLNSLSGEEEDGGRTSPLPAKRVRVSDINITRYEEEFLELSEIASGQFGTVKRARHRLDGMVYAVKVTKKPIRVNSHDEKVAMNEVFAHAALIKHKHVVRYYNSWVEKGQVYIQNELCEGGSLQKQIETFRQTGARFSEAELKRIIVHVAKGLQYIHSKQLAHLDIKPGNIFISLEYVTPTPPRKTEHSTDSGAASGDHSPCCPLRGDQTPLEPTPQQQQQQQSSCESSPGDGEKVHYKIGDLGHVASIFGGDVDPEEGDCRYMAPEFLEMEVDKSRLPKADIFSLGLTVYEAASLKKLPRNSLDDPVYERIKRGELEYLEQYSREFNSLLRLMVNPDPAARPTAAKLLANPLLNPTMTKSRSQLYKELKEARDKVAQLEQQLLLSSHKVTINTTSTIFYQDKENSAPLPSVAARSKLMKRLVGRGQPKAASYIRHCKLSRS